MYKRQIKAREHEPDAEQWLAEADQLIREPVSYTHLDVYKRQATVEGTVRSRDGGAYVLAFTTAGGSHRLHYQKTASANAYLNQLKKIS